MSRSASGGEWGCASAMSSEGDSGKGSAKEMDWGKGSVMETRTAKGTVMSSGRGWGSQTVKEMGWATGKEKAARWHERLCARTLRVLAQFRHALRQGGLVQPQVAAVTENNLVFGNVGEPHEPASGRLRGPKVRGG